MLELHINRLLKHKKNIKFVLINNGNVSHWLCGRKTKNSTKNDQDIKTKEVRTYKVKEVPIFYSGRMLSGQGLLDTFSRKRLEDEIKNYSKKP